MLLLKKKKKILKNKSTLQMQKEFTQITFFLPTFFFACHSTAGRLAYLLETTAWIKLIHIFGVLLPVSVRKKKSYLINQLVFSSVHYK